MSMLWDISQSHRIGELEDRVTLLEEQLWMAARWINYLREEYERKNTRGVDDHTGEDRRPEEGS